MMMNDDALWRLEKPGSIVGFDRIARVPLSVRIDRSDASTRTDERCRVANYFAAA